MTIDLEKLDIEFKTKAKKCDSLEKKMIFCESFLKKYKVQLPPSTMVLGAPSISETPEVRFCKQLKVGCQVNKHSILNNTYSESDVHRELCKAMFEKLLDDGFIRKYDEFDIITNTQRYGMTLWVSREI